MAKRAYFKFLTGDVNYVDYGGKFVREVGEGKFHVMELMNWNEHDPDPDLTYNVSLSEVDVAATPDETLEKVLASWGLELTDDEGKPHPWMLLVDALHGYGSKAPLYEENGNNYRKLMKDARSYSSELTSDPDLYEAKMREPVNRLGSTAREYQQGNIVSAMTRGVVADKPEANLMARCYGVTEANLVQVRHTTSQGVAVYVPEDEQDSLAYAAGSIDAFAGADMKRGPDISKAYTRGYKETVQQRST